MDPEPMPIEISEPPVGCWLDLHVIRCGHDLAARLKGLPSRLPLPLVFGRLLGDQIRTTERLSAGIANWAETSRVAAAAVGKIHGPAFLRRLDPGLTPGTQRQQHRVEGFALLGQMILVA